MEVESMIYEQLQNKTGFTTQNLMRYLFLDSMRDRKDAKILIGLDNGIVGINQGQKPTQ